MAGNSAGGNSAGGTSATVSRAGGNRAGGTPVISTVLGLISSWAMASSAWKAAKYNYKSLRQDSETVLKEAHVEAANIRREGSPPFYLIVGTLDVRKAKRGTMRVCTIPRSALGYLTYKVL